MPEDGNWRDLDVIFSRPPIIWPGLHPPGDGYWPTRGRTSDDPEADPDHGGGEEAGHRGADQAPGLNYGEDEGEGDVVQLPEDEAVWWVEAEVEDSPGAGHCDLGSPVS